MFGSQGSREDKPIEDKSNMVLLGTSDVTEEILPAVDVAEGVHAVSDDGLGYPAGSDGDEGLQAASPPRSKAAPFAQELL